MGIVMGEENRELETRVKHLEERVEMLAEIADSETKPFTFLALESGLSHEQVKKILDLMERVRDTMKQKKPMHHAQFEQAIYEIVPTHKGDYHFAESVVLTLKDEHRYEDVYKHMKKSGMNLH